MAKDTDPFWVDPTDLVARLCESGLSDDDARRVANAARRKVPVQMTPKGMAMFWPHVRQIAERFAPTVGHKVQLALDALNALAKDKVDVRNMPDDDLLPFVKDLVKKRTKAKTSVSKRTMQAARGIWREQNPISPR